MTSRSAWFQAHRRSILLLFTLLTVGGSASVFRLPVSLFPATTFPRIVIDADAGDRPADRMVLEVTHPIEEAVRGVPGIRDVRSTTTRGTCEISATFDWGLDMVSKTLEVNAAIGQTKNDLPSGLTYEVRRMDPTVFPVMGLSLTSPSESLVSLRDRAFYELRPLLSSARGVARIVILGGRSEEYQVLLDPLRLVAAGITLDQVVRAVSASNVVQAVGRLQADEKLYLVLSDTRFTEREELAGVIVGRGPTGVVLLSDVATIEDSASPEWTRVTASGSPAVLVDVYQQPDGDTTRISREIADRVAAYRQRAPADLEIRTWYDQSELIRASAASVRDAILIGIALAVVVLLAFLRNWKITLVVSMAVPAVLTTTALLLQQFHMGLNIMTLGGMAAAVGLIVDDGIVMVEHIVRRLRAGEQHDHRSIPGAAREMFRPLTASSLATIVIFVPLAFLSGVTGAFFKALSLTMASALLVSYLFAALSVPVLSDLFLGAGDAARDDVGRVFRAVLSLYERVLRVLLRKRSILAVLVAGFLLLGWFSYRHVGSGFMPRMDEGGFILDYRAPAGTSLDETDRRLQLVEAILLETPEVDTYSRRTGLALGGGVTEANEGDFFVRLRPMPRRPIAVVMNDIRARIHARVPGLEVEFAQLMEDLIGDLTAVPQPIEIKLFGSDGGTLRHDAALVAAAIEPIPGVVDTRSGVVLAGDALDMKIDRVRAETLGLDADQVTHLARIALGGSVATEVQRGEKMVGVRVWTSLDARSRIDLLRQLRVETMGHTSVRLGRIADFSRVSGQPQITRENLASMVAVTGRISGRDMGSVIRDVKDAVNALGLSSGVYVEYGGLYSQQRKSFRDLLVVLVAATALVFVLLVYLYETFRAPLAILSTALLAVTGVFSGLWWTGSELNISSMMGLTMIVGITSEAAIFFLDEWRGFAGSGDLIESLVSAGRHRFRPILMTGLAAILALAPLAMGIGQGSAMLQPLAIAIISGLVLAFPLVVLVLPALLSLLHAPPPRHRMHGAS